MQEFKDFLMRGNLIEMAVAFIMGSVFAPVVEAFTKIIMDIIGLLFGLPDFSELAVGGVNIGVFITAVIAFILTALVVFLFVVKPYNKYQKRAEEKAAAEKGDEPEPPTQEELLTEIRDALTRQIR